MKKIRMNAGWKWLAVMVIFALTGFFSEAQAFQVLTNDENAVRVDVKPIQLAAGKPAVFEVRFNTHSVNLSYDLAAISSIQDGKGKVYKATAWKGSSGGGHHRSGMLEFPELKGNPQTIKLIIRGVADVPTRVFEWKLES